jgi:hypothetical protein
MRWLFGAMPKQWVSDVETCAMSKLRVEDVAAALPPERTESAWAARVRGMLRARIIPPRDLERTGKPGRPAMLFDQSAPAAIHVLFWLEDHCGVTEPDVLAQAWEYLTIPHEPGDCTPIDSILFEIHQGNDARLLLTTWRRAHDNSIKQTCAIRLDDDARPATAPGPGFKIASEITLSFATLLGHFVGRRVSN